MGLVNSKQSKYLDLARNHAIANIGFKRFKIAAVVTIGNRIISVGQNSGNTHPAARRYQKAEGAECLHAEIDAIVRALRVVDAEELAKATIFIARVKHPSTDSREWVDGLAKPCEGCANALSKYKFKNVIWTKDDGC